MLSHFSCVQLFATPWITARQAPLSMEFSRHEYWSGLPFPIVMINDMEYHVIYLIGNLYVFFEKMSIQVLCPFKKWDYLSFCY